MKKKILILSILSVVFMANITAQDKASDIKKLMQVMNTEKTIDGMMSNMSSMLKQQVSQTTRDKEKQDTFINYLTQEIKEMSYKLVNEEMPNIYDKYFTHEEINDLIKFYESPTGKKMLEKTPEISADLMNAMSGKYMPNFQEKLKNKMEESK